MGAGSPGGYLGQCISGFIFLPGNVHDGEALEFALQVPDHPKVLRQLRLSSLILLFHLECYNLGITLLQSKNECLVFYGIVGAEVIEAESVSDLLP